VSRGRQIAEIKALGLHWWSNMFVTHLSLLTLVETNPLSHSFIMHVSMRTLLFACLPFAVLGATKRAMSEGSPFQLYAYGDGCGGLPLYYADGLSYVGRPNLSNSSDAAVVTCESCQVF
jgi:hypothetical protein